MSYVYIILYNMLLYYNISYNILLYQVMSTTGKNKGDLVYHQAPIMISHRRQSVCSLRSRAHLNAVGVRGNRVVTVNVGVLAQRGSIFQLIL